ncbi:hypothetical protein Tco_0607112 [Tanacetum coccineum]
MASESTSSKQSPQLPPSSKDEPLSFTKDEIISAIGLPICKDLVLLPPKETVRAELATLGLFDKDKPTLSSTVLPKQSLIPPSGEVNVDDTADKSLSRASKVILPKKQVTETQHAEVIMATADATKSLEASELAEEQVNQPLAAKTKKEPEKIVQMEKEAEEQSLVIPTIEQLLDEVDKQNKAIQETLESLYDRESEIKVVKSYFASHIPKSKDQIMHDFEETAYIQEDSNYESMPEDDLRSVLELEAADSNNKEGNDVSHSDHTFPEHNAFTERLSLSDHLDHICEESDGFARLEMELSKTLKSDMGKSLTSLVKSGMKESLLESAVIIDDTAEEEQNKKAKDANPVATQGEHQPAKAEPLVES